MFFLLQQRISNYRVHAQWNEGVKVRTPTPAPHYNLEEYISCLSEYFEKVDIIDYKMPEGIPPHSYPL